MTTKPKTMAETLAELRSKDKVEIGVLSDFNMRPEGLSTGNIALDFLTGVRGYPVGGVVEQFGPPSSGKTTSALQSMAITQERILGGDLKGYVAFFDYEKSLDEAYCRALGLDVDDKTFIYLQPTSFENGANIYRRLLATGELRQATFDSVAAMVTENELSAETGKANVADRAKMMHQFMRQVNDVVHRQGSSLVFLNHTMELVDTSPMGQKLAARGIKRMTQPGGKALPFYAKLRIEFRQVGNLRTSELDTLTNSKTDLIRSTKVQATVVKNKVGDPFGTAELRVRWGRGFSQAYSVLDILHSYTVVTRDGAGQYYLPLTGAPETLAAQAEKKKQTSIKVKGEEAAIALIEANPSWLSTLESIAADLLTVHGAKKVDGSAYDSNGEVADVDAILAGADDDITGMTLDDETGELA